MNEKVASILESALDSEPERKGKQGEYGFSCPFCKHPESKKKLWINLDPEKEEFGWYQCWVCKESGKSLFNLLKKVNAPKFLFKRLSKHVDEPSYVPNNNEEDEEEFNLSLPDEFRPLWEEQSGIICNHAMNRLRDRGITDGDIVKHRIGYCSSGTYSKRIVIPSYDEDGDLNYFVARRMWSNQFPKYKNPSAPRNSIVPFENLINWRAPVTIVEGPFDAISIRRNAVPLLGSKMNDALFCRLMEEDVQEVNVALDPDMRHVALKMGKKLIEEGVTVRVVELPHGKDPDDMGFSEFWSLVKETEPSTLDDILLKRLEGV